MSRWYRPVWRLVRARDRLHRLYAAPTFRTIGLAAKRAHVSAAHSTCRWPGIPQAPISTAGTQRSSSTTTSCAARSTWRDCRLHEHVHFNEHGQFIWLRKCQWHVPGYVLHSRGAVLGCVWRECLRRRWRVPRWDRSRPPILESVPAWDGLLGLRGLPRVVRHCTATCGAQPALAATSSASRWLLQPTLRIPCGRDHPRRSKRVH